MMSASDARPPVCGARQYLPGRLVPLALRLETSRDRPAETADVARGLRCTMQAHGDEVPHYGLVLDLAGAETGSVWTTWAAGSVPELLVVLPDCPGDGGRPCNEWAAHPGGHTWQVHDPLSDVSHTLSQ